MLPFGRPKARSGARLRIGRAGVAVGLAGIFDPVVAVVTVFVATGLVAGALVTINPTGVARLVAATVGAALVGALLTLPLSIELLSSGLPWHPFADGRTGDASTEPLTDLLRFAIGPDSAALFTWAFAIPMTVPLLVGRAWRFELAVRLWFVALVAWALALIAVHGVLPFGVPEPGVLVAPAAIAVAALCGVCVSALEHDLRRDGSGWRQVVLPVVIGAAVVAALPGIGGITDGRWGLGRGGYENVLPLADPALDGSYRVLWVGHPDHLPAQGSPFVADMAWVATIDGLPDITERTIPADRGAHEQVELVLEAILEGDTLPPDACSAALVSAMWWRSSGSPRRRSAISTMPGHFPLRSSKRSTPNSTCDASPASTAPFASTRTPSGSRLRGGQHLRRRPHLAVRSAGRSDHRHDRDTRRRGTRYAGIIPDGVELFVAQTADGGWRLEVAGVEAAQRRSLDWATTFVPSAGGGEAVLAYTTPRWKQLVVIVQLLALIGTVSLAVRRLIGGRR